MNKKNILKKTAALVLGSALTVAATGCNFVLTDNQKDMAQTIAEVDITKSMAGGEYAELATEISSILKLMPSKIIKRDLVANFLSYGYQQAQTYGYEMVFTQLLDSMVKREVLVQYAVAHYLKAGKEDGITAVNCGKYKDATLAAMQAEIDKLTAGTEARKNLEDEKALLEKHPEVLTLKYFLTNGGKTDKDSVEDYNYTVYSLRKSFNDSLDNLEAKYAKAEEKEHNHATAQTLPKGIDTQKEKYYPTNAAGELNYSVYTGRNLVVDCGEYETIEGSTTATRRKAYNDFLSNLQSYNLVQSKGDKVENTKEAVLLDYYYVELSSALGQALIDKYFADMEDKVLEGLNDVYATKKYSEQLADQELAYEKNSDAFNTAIGSESATSITLYGLENFGFVYNILLPFSTEQNEVYARAENSGLTANELFNVRKSLAKNIVGKDQRAGWINEHEDESHATYVEGATAEEAGKWVFFQDILDGKSEFEKPDHYLGLIPFNGTATLVDEKYEYTYNDVTVDSVLGDLKTLVEANVTGASVAIGDVEASYEQDNMATKYVDEKGETDYSKFVYRKATIKVGDVNPYDYFNETSNVYKMLSVANEMMFAYSTDTGCLNTYMGYAVTPYTTQFVKEFEYAAQQAVKETVATMKDTDGSVEDAFSVYAVPTQFGWHIIIPTFVFEGGEVYGGYNHADKDVEGTFSNIYYEYLKTDAVASYRTDVESKVNNTYNNEDSVTLYKSRYQDLLDL